MPYHIVEIKRPSSNAISKMKKGLPVRISAGSGFPIVVDTSRLDDIARKFGKGAAHTVALTKDELNKNYEHLSGHGIFGKKFDRTLEKHGVKKLAYHLADLAKPVVKGGIDTLAGAASLAQPELAPLAMGAAYLANDYIDNPDAYTHEKVKQKASEQLQQKLNEQFGTNYGNDLQATMNDLAQNSKMAEIRKDNNISAATSYLSPIITSGVNGPQTLNQVLSVPTVLPVDDTLSLRHSKNPRTVGNGLYVSMASRGNGLYASMAGGNLTSALINANAKTFPGHGLHAKRHGKIYEKGSVMAGGNLLYNSQATSSQPFMEYFMQSNFLPPSARKFRTTATNNL